MTPKSKTIGLALGSGGWRGLAHIGVIKSLVKHDFQIDYLAGASAGALIGGMYALWNDIDRVEEIFKKLTYQDLLSAFSDPSVKTGLFKGNKAIALFEKYLGKATFNDLKLKFVAVGTDIVSGNSVILDTGSLALAIRASSSIPLVFNPVVVNNQAIIDGGISHPVPVSVVRQLGATTIIAVNVYQCIFPIRKSPGQLSKVDIAMLSTNLMLNQLSRRDAAAADVVIEPDLDHAQSDPFLQFINNQQAIDAGEQAMDAKIQLLG